MITKRQMSAVTVGSLALLHFFAESQARAFWPNHDCNGSVTWHHNVTLFRDVCSAPTTDPRGSAFLSSMWNWYTVAPGLVNRFPTSIYNDGCRITDGNGRNEFAVMTRQSIGGNKGLTLMRWTSCLFSVAEYKEADVMVADDLIYTNEDESFWNWSEAAEGQAIVTHELGHYFGLGHQDPAALITSIMRSGGQGPLALIGGTGFHGAPYPDDATGARYFYPGSTVTDLFASAQKLNPATNRVEATDLPNQITKCRGSNINVTTTVGNDGNTPATNVSFRIYLTQTPGVAAGGINLFVGAVSFSPNPLTQTRTLQIPSMVPNGAYWIQWEIDSGHSISESSENNNFVHSAMTINVNC